MSEVAETETEPEIEELIKGIFDDNNSGWQYASKEECKRGKFWPNTLAYCRDTETLVLIVKRSMAGEDYAMSQAGLLYLEAALERGHLEANHRLPASRAVVLQAAPDPTPKNKWLPYKVARVSTVQEIIEHLAGLPANPGNYNGPFWWLQANEGMFVK